MKSRAGSGKDFSEFLLVIGGVMACVITPVFVVFLHSLYKVHLSPWELFHLLGWVRFRLLRLIVRTSTDWKLRVCTILVVT